LRPSQKVNLAERQSRAGAEIEVPHRAKVFRERLADAALAIGGLNEESELARSNATQKVVNAMLWVDVITLGFEDGQPVFRLLRRAAEFRLALRKV
jgi:hypothetical protein